MKKTNFVILQLTLAIILITVGLLIELKGTNNVPGIASIFMTIPGCVLIFSLLLELVKIKKFWIRIIIIVLASLIPTLVCFYYFHIAIKSYVIVLVTALVILVESAIGFIFHVIYYYINKKLSFFAKLRL